ncbi:Btz multi-domain protein [Pyrenophora tritici-repentis]|uniref:Btz multi-domain protein n=1 Tax=Pyrenophora tritici-repentis TaxID=45151 RepID=A0A2W1FZ88_9PLEO|nr:Btz multi-domain protein [Pyrenophora tritici-repentis]KAF7577596.1 Btz multi-domain protein [Pyrenophora tritici-repentis]KAI0587078.1 Btz multi-domain protein [Pyrenophora tritici-repentis]KAI1674346.1 CASC3/Barentsz eIF4AIII binding [Pyrenophora tritici-repentis]KAI1688539.1 CASC3/Barentsz eIF4AIII binding [Pyrenophora tritici-repentis]
MAPARKRSTNIARRRRTDDEDESQSVATLADDSQSDASVLSDVDEDADADNSDLSEVDSAPSLTQGKSKRKANGARDAKPRQSASDRQPSPPIARSDVAFTALKETEIMMNGLKIGEGANEAKVVDFETGVAAGEVAPAVGAPSSRAETLAERRRREHDEYKKKRDSDPAFIPNRGAFFMHDQRHAPGQNGFRPAGRGRGRGAPIRGPFSPANMRPQPPEATDSPWQHDLHETVNAPGSQAHPHPPSTASNQHASNAQLFASRVPPGPAQKATPARNFSTTVHTHNAMVRVFLPNMKGPIHFQNVPIKQHTRLPNHRPPLRRDKPVRISLPPAPPRYIFPTTERSFIFIPRALRPNQQGFGRGRGRFGSFGGGFSSRRTSAYGGSVYSPSVAMSRRSSIAREMGRDNLVSPAGSIMSRNGGFADPSRPVVRLPPGGPRMPSGPSIISPTNGAVQPPYPLPQKPTFRENWQGQIPMHQPRPQKTVSVAGIESPASMSFNPPQQQEQQPFHQQVPAHINGATQANDQSFYQHGRHPSYPSQVSTGTPLNNIPERAIHAPTFQPYAQPGFQPQAFVPQGYYYPQNNAQPQYMAPAGMVPMFVPGAQQPEYVMPVSAPPVAAPPAPAGPPNMVAYESNGMTYYVDSAQLYPAPAVDNYAQPSYAVPGMGGMMTPGPDGAYYYPQQMQPAAYYPQQ